MNRGLIVKSFREIWPATLGLGLLLFLGAMAIAFVTRQVGGNEFAGLLKSGFLQSMISSMVGVRVTADLGKLVAQTLTWTDPLILIILFAHRVTICTQLPAGEIDRGTIDVLMALPVSRRQVYVCHTLVWIGSGVFIILAGIAGDWCGAHWAHDTLAPGARVFIVFVNGVALYLAWGGFSYFVSCLSSRRGSAIAVLLSVFVGLSLLGVVSETVSVAKTLNQYTPMYYFRPLFIFRDGVWPVASIMKLLAAGIVFWTAGLIVFQRRDLHTA